MANRTAKFVSAIFAGFLAGVALTTVSNSGARAAGDCLTGPKDQTPQGGHWYYRVDRVTKRHCWYLGEQREKLSRVAPQNPAPSANPVLPQQEPATRRSITAAHAELPSPQTRIEAPNRNDALIPAMPAELASIENSQPANSPEANTQRSVIASRWPEQSGVSSSASPEVTPGDSAVTVPSNSTATPSPAVAAVTLTTAASSSKKQSGSVQMLLIAIVGALSLAGLVGSAIFRFGGRRQIRADRRSIWDSVDTARLSPAAYPRAGVSMRRVDIPHELRAADDPNGRIGEMLARLSRSAAT